jgi:dUTPase
VERLVLDCSANYENHTITIDNAFTTIASDLKPEIISFEIENLTNPIHDVVTDSFRIMTRTWDFF